MIYSFETELLIFRLKSFYMHLHLTKDEYNTYYQTYIDKVTFSDIIEGLVQGKKEFNNFILNIPDDKLHYRYAQDKWTVAEVILHLIDTERIFAYRALRIARNDQTPLPGFEQDDYVPTSNAIQYTKLQLLREYNAVRESSITLFEGLSDNTLKNLGIASNYSISVRAIGYILAGHEEHHKTIIATRYL